MNQQQKIAVSGRLIATFGVIGTGYFQLLTLIDCLLAQGQTSPKK
jgi:hypothetical protein